MPVSQEGIGSWKPPPTGEARRLLLWIFWTVNMNVDAGRDEWGVWVGQATQLSRRVNLHSCGACMGSMQLLNIIYICISFATSSRLVNSYNDLTIAINNSAWRAPVAACVLGGLMVLTFNAMSCAVLIRKSINKSGPGFGYGFIMAWCFVMSFLTFLCGLVLDAFGDIVKSDLQKETNWKGYWTSAYYGTVALAFICCAMYMIFFLCLVVFQGGISKAIGLYDIRTDEKHRHQLTPINNLASQAI